MSVKSLFFPRLMLGFAALFLVLALDGCAIQVRKTKAELVAEQVARDKVGAEAGDAAAQYRYGAYFLAMKKDLVTAYSWFLKSAQGGNREGEEAVAQYYFWGTAGVPKDRVIAASWMRKAAEQDNNTAQYSLATMYAEGVGVPKDKAKYIEWLEKATMNWNLNALNDLTRQGDPHGVAQRLRAQWNENQRATAERVRNEELLQAIRQQNSQPVQQQRMCSVNNGQVIYQAPC